VIGRRPATRRQRRILLAAVILIASGMGCASVHRSAQAVKAPPADADNVLGLIGRTTIAHACPIGPEELLTAGHVFDPRPLDNSAPLVGASYSTPGGQSGEVIPTWSTLTWDIAFGRPAESFSRFYAVAKDEPKPGEKLWLASWDFASQDTAFSQPVLEVTVTRLAAGYVILREEIPAGTSGGCVLNARSEVVGIVSMGIPVGSPTDARAVSAIVSVYGPWLERMREAKRRREREASAALQGAFQ
jgi:hypothetical protein